MALPSLSIYPRDGLGDSLAPPNFPSFAFRYWRRQASTPKAFVVVVLLLVVKEAIQRMVPGNGLFYPIIGFASFLVLIYWSFGDLWVNYRNGPELSFVQRNGTHFMVDGRVFYVNGWNSYWLMDHAVDHYTRPRVREMLRAGAKMGLTVCRTWAFNDGAYNALQISPGRYDERVFRALDHVIAEARKHGIRLLLSLVNNLLPYGGKTQYVKWAWEEGVALSSSNDSFFYDPSIRNYFKNHVKVIHLISFVYLCFFFPFFNQKSLGIAFQLMLCSHGGTLSLEFNIGMIPPSLLTRVNSITGIAYKDDPTIFAWELINEPRCISDLSGNTLQVSFRPLPAFILMSIEKTKGIQNCFTLLSTKVDWIEEMSVFVKSIDKKHLLTIGLEGFYGPQSPKRLTVNPGEWAANLGSDFIRNSKISTIDFATVHIYPDQWFPEQELEEKLKYVSKWMVSHIEDGDKELRKPIMFTEFGLSNLSKGFQPSQRERFYKIAYDIIYESAQKNDSGAGSVVWQFLVGGMEEYNDDYGIVPWESPSMYRLITQHSCRLAVSQGVLPSQKEHLKELCLQRR
ncbi:hypothetical protein C3L33_10441, partial [Rhododendron williamsianum]